MKFFLGVLFLAQFSFAATQVKRVEVVGVPVGAVQAFALVSCPSGWIAADGSAVSRTTYSTLYAAMGTIHGTGDGSTTYNLPDYRGMFLRGAINIPAVTG